MAERSEPCDVARIGSYVWPVGPSLLDHRPIRWPLVARTSEPKPVGRLAERLLPVVISP